MSPTMLFRAYAKTVSRKEAVAESITSSKYVNTWESWYYGRLCRLAGKLENRIMRYLKEYESYEWHNRDNATRLTSGY